MVRQHPGGGCWTRATEIAGVGLWRACWRCSINSSTSLIAESSMQCERTIARLESNVSTLQAAAVHFFGVRRCGWLPEPTEHAHGRVQNNVLAKSNSTGSRHQLRPGLGGKARNLKLTR